MKKFIKMLFHRNDGIQNSDSEFTITRGLPQPIRNVDFKDQMRIVTALENLSTGCSFPIRKELSYAAYKMAKDLFPEYKIVIRNMGTLKRVYRVA